MAKSTTIIRVASIIAFLMAGLAVSSALTGQIILLPLALIPLAAGIGILRNRVWNSYGFALYLSGQLLLLPFVLSRSGSAAENLAAGIVGAAFLIVLIPLFLLAGRSLATGGAERGWAWPWIAVSVLTTLPLCFVQAFVIPTGTMEDTLLIGDRVLVQRVPKPSPKFGDMIVFAYPVDGRETYVKRVIGVAGDRIRISSKSVYRNGVQLNETYALHKTAYVDSYRDNFPGQPNIALAGPGLEMLKKYVANGEVVVEDNNYFVLGDNRDLSWDSRYWGFVPANDVLGTPLLIYDSRDGAGQGSTSAQPASLKRVRWDRLLKFL